ncbi:hypothetical protein [Nocardia yamanashiensis]|uniref:hypothetical protein n=1 Tax=Nocardia yamanashiensis TaxID=209247 RepID=UPI0008342112|nr:hypothetical protein [Nocardia yamanashiensis]
MIRDAGAYLLNQLVLLPAGWPAFETSHDFDEQDWLDMAPTSAGVYLFHTPGHHFEHPGGSSSVLYIGSATGCEGLRARLRNHRKYSRGVRNGGFRGYARYEWMITHPTLITYSPAPSPDDDAEAMERSLISTFADAFRVAPLANARSAWPPKQVAGIEE